MNKIARVGQMIASNVITSVAQLERLDVANLPLRTRHTGFVMCGPTHYRVDYDINPYMTGNIGHVNRGRAILQWMRLRHVLREEWRCPVHEMRADKRYPDMVFAANGALTYVRNGKKRALTVRMRNKEREGEWRLFATYLSRVGYDIEIEYLPEGVYFEGEGDARLDSERELLWGGHGIRSSLESSPYVSERIGMPVIALRLADQRFYHLDTCFLPFKDKDRRCVMFYPEAFDLHSREIIRHAFPDPYDRIELSEEEASDFPCNTPILGNNMVMPEGAPRIFGIFKERGFNVVQTPMSEFKKGGGAAKCLVLEDYE